MTAEQKLALKTILDIVLLTIKEAGKDGAPAGPMYAALMSIMSLDQFEAIMAGLAQTGRVRKQGHVYFYVRGL